MPGGKKLFLRSMLLFVLLSQPSFAAIWQDDEGLGKCENEQLQLEAIEAPFVRISHASYAAAYPDFNSKFEITNLKQKKILQVYVMADYLDSSGSALFSYVFHSLSDSDDKMMLEMPDAYAGIPYTGFGEPIPYLASSSIAGGGSLRTTSCPASLRLSSIEVQYDDKSWERYHVPNWILEPQPDGHFSKWKNDLIVDDLPLTLDCDIKIGSSGKATIQECQNLPNRISAWITNEITHWSFFPGLVGGHAHPFSFRALILVEKFYGNSPDSRIQARKRYIDAVKKYSKQHQSFVVVTLTPVDKQLHAWEGYWDRKPLYVPDLTPSVP
jgi:hypothetical protein